MKILAVILAASLQVATPIQKPKAAPPPRSTFVYHSGDTAIVSMSSQLPAVGSYPVVLKNVDSGQQISSTATVVAHPNFKRLDVVVPVAPKGYVLIQLGTIALVADTARGFTIN